MISLVHMVRRAALWMGAAALVGGCADTLGEECVLADGRSGPCCELRLDNGNTAEGACIESVCTNGMISQASGTCGGGPREVDAIVRELSDFGPIGGEPAGGAGGEPMGGAGGDTGGMGGVPGGAGGEPVGGDQGGAGGEPMGDPCMGVICDIGERCDPETGVCVSSETGQPAGPCLRNEDCGVGMCLPPDNPDNPIPGGFCLVECERTADCGSGRLCLPNADSQICFEQCDENEPCREGWTCAPVEDIGGVCLPDCREVGCNEGQVCNEGTGLCEVPPAPCPYPCAAGEVCNEGRCIRDNGTCVTDYHCPLDRSCSAGRCIIPEFSDCNVQNDCDASQTCVPLQNGGGFCLFSCVNDAACPSDRACLATQNSGNVCYYNLCGPSQNNGTLYGDCTVGSQRQWEGTCMPVERGNPADPNDFGLCIEAGTAAAGQPCNAQEEGRDANARSLQCASGLLCVEDPDDPLDPGQNWDARGYCASLCNPLAAACAAGEACVDFGSDDDPQTPQDETRLLGLCLLSDCEVTANDCAGGLNCRPYTLIDNQGICTAAGQVALGQPCTENTECADQALCADPGGGDVCLALCDPAAADCPDGQTCAEQPGWAFGVCL